MRHDCRADNAHGNEQPARLDDATVRQVAGEGIGPVGLNAVEQDAEADCRLSAACVTMRAPRTTMTSRPTQPSNKCIERFAFSDG